MKDILRKAIAELRHKEIITNQTDFGDKLGYSKTYISRLLNGHEPFTENIAAEMETMFRLNKKWLLTGEGEMFITSTTNNNPNNQVLKAVISEPNEQNIVNEMLVTSLEPTNQGGNDMNTLQSMQRTQENYSIAEKNRSEAAKDTAKTQLILAELLQLKFGEDGLKKASGM